MQENNDKSKKIILAYAIVGIISVSVSLIGCYFLLDNKKHSAPDIVYQFLDEFIVEEYTPTYGLGVFLHYFSTTTGYSMEDIRAADDPSELIGNDQLAFEYIFRGFYDGTSKYEVEVVHSNFVIVRLCDYSGALQPPPVGFWFEV